MTMPEVSCTAVAMQNSSEWPCSMCPIPQLRLVGVRTSDTYFSLIFPEHPEFWTPLQIPICPTPLAAPCYTHTHRSRHSYKASPDWRPWELSGLLCHLGLWVPIVLGSKLTDHLERPVRGEQ